MNIQSVYPADEAEGVVIGIQIWFIMDEEIDPTTVDRAFIVTGPDSDRWAGSVLQIFDRPQTPDPEFFLESPAYTGVVRGTFTIQKLDPSGEEIEEPTYYYGQAAYRSKIIFTPEDHLGTLTEYIVTVLGDELDTDDIKAGLASRTVFDTRLGSNTGNGTVSITGGYTGEVDDSFVIVITTGGNIGTAGFEWYKGTAPLIVHSGVTSNNELLMDDGVYVSFGGTGFVVGDTFTTGVRPPQYMSGSFRWNFTTGSGSITAVPGTTSTSVLGDVGASSVDTTPFAVLEVTPAHRATQQKLTTRQIIVRFTDPLDEDTVTQDSVTVRIEPVRGAFSGNPVADIGEIPKALSVSGSTLTIEI